MVVEVSDEIARDLKRPALLTVEFTLEEISDEAFELLTGGMKKPEYCERAVCGRPVEMMVQKMSGFCSRNCEEYEYWEEEFDDPETDTA